jgi:hypothetical protein
MSSLMAETRFDSAYQRRKRMHILSHFLLSDLYEEKQQLLSP